MEIELVYADGDDFHKLDVVMVGADLRIFIDGEEKQIVGKIWVGEDALSDRLVEERTDTGVSREAQIGKPSDGGL